MRILETDKAQKKVAAMAFMDAGGLLAGLPQSCSLHLLCRAAALHVLVLGGGGLPLVLIFLWGLGIGDAVLILTGQC